MIRACAFFVALLFGAPSQAQIGMSQGVCADSLIGFSKLAARQGNDALADMLRDRSGSVKLAGGGWCRLTDVAFSIDQNTGFFAKTLQWKGKGFARLTSDALPPTAFALQAENLRYVPPEGSKAATRFSGKSAVMAPVNLDVALKWDERSKVLELTRLYLDLPGASDLSVNMRVYGVDMRTRDTLNSTVLRWELRQATAILNNDGFLGRLMDDLDVQASGAAGVAGAAIYALPNEMMDQAAKSAVGAFLDKWPDPLGTFEIEMLANAGLSLLRLAPLAAAGEATDAALLLETLRGLRFSATYAP